MTLELEIQKILDQLGVQDEYFYAAKEEATTELEALVREREKAALILATRGIQLDIDQLFKEYAEADKEQPK